VSESRSGSAHFYSGQEKSYRFLGTWEQQTTEITGAVLVC